MNQSERRIVWIAAAFLTVSLATRIGLAVFSREAYGVWDWARFLGFGVLYDAAVLPGILLPWALYEAIRPMLARFGWRGRLERIWAQIWAGLWLSFLLVVAAAEFAFWGEFSSRFDFIAVDYLVYTHEVIGNIRESYPTGWIMAGIFAVSLLLCRLTWPRGADSTRRWPVRWALAGGVGALAFGLPSALSQDFAESHVNSFVGQLSNNGIFAFVHAFRHNELDYARYYPVLPKDRLENVTRSLLQQTNTRFLNETGIDREVGAVRPLRKVNIVLVSVESLSGEYLGHFGNTEGLTPELDRLADEGRLFTRFYATGTRTVRGLEALSVGTPPTPGQSIVRRPQNQGLENLGEELGENGWHPYWIYGGYGFFDNMNDYFAANHYTVIDRSAVGDAGVQIHHENIWGIADEDLYSLAMTAFDRSYAKGEAFFGHIMTTSNHRPFTFPDGRIDIESGRREGAVKYTDWAIGDFIRRARDKPWFDNTLFILTADHTAKASGRVDLPPDRYHIPMVWYAPKLVEPDVMSRLMSQMDLAPTLLGWLGIGYDSRFMGYDMATLEPGRERAFISTYQKLGYLKGDRLVVLDVNRPPVVEPGLPAQPGAPATDDRQLIEEGIAWYQAASRLFNSGGLEDIGPAQPARSVAH
jgi:phosphoglycerol transferase MdoB-like AlkP superfamily enzyme